MVQVVQNYIRGTTAVKIAASIEEAVRAGILAPGQPLPPVRMVSASLGVSPATVASAYRTLQIRGILQSNGRQGTRVSHRNVIKVAAPPALPASVINLRDGNPDRALLPPMDTILREIDPSPRMYGSPRNDANLLKIAARDYAADGINTGPISVVNGATDGLERVLREHLRAGDRVAMEDPGFGSITDLVTSLGLRPVPVLIDDEGVIPDELGRAFSGRVQALILTPRVQNPTGAAMTPQRVEDVRAVLARAPETLVIEDDHASLIADAPAVTVVNDRIKRWAVVRSMSKGLNPDLRIALVTGDEVTMSRVEDRLVVGERWVSHVLQQITAALLSDRTVRKHLANVAGLYRRRRTALMNALAQRGINSHGRSGFNVWIPVAQETPVVEGMLERGWAVRAGESFRTKSPPAIRITASALTEDVAIDVASAFASVLAVSSRTFGA